MRFSECEALIERMWALRKTRVKKIAHRTILYQIDSGTYGIKYHDTTVVKIHRNDTYTLNSGGFLTPTTKKRINTYSPGRIFQKDWKWYIFSSVNGPQPFSDNCVIDRFGTLVENKPKRRKEPFAYVSLMYKPKRRRNYK